MGQAAQPQTTPEPPAMMLHTEGTVPPGMFMLIMKSLTKIGDYIAKDESVLSGIQLCCTANVMSLVITCTSAKEAWDRLELLYGTHSLIRIITMCRKLF